MRRTEFLALASSVVALGAPSDLGAYMIPHVTMAEFAGIVATSTCDWMIEPFGGDFDESTRFRVASVAKTFTAATADALFKTGALSLDTKLGALLPPFANSPITIDHLLNHSSGIPDIYSLPEFASGHRYPISKSDYIALLAKQKLAFAPGTKGQYSNSGYSLLAFAIEAAAGRPFADVQQERVLNPLGLRDTGMLPGTNVVPGADPGAPNATRPAEPLDPSWLIGNGSLYSTAADMLRWLNAIHDGTAIRTRSWPYPWGWGQDKTKTILESDGRYAGFACMLKLNLNTGQAVVVLSAIQSAVVNVIARDLMDLSPANPFVPVALRNFAKLLPTEAREYEGHYSLSPDFVLEVRAFNDAIQIASADGVFEALDPLGDDRFFFRVLNSALTFRRAATGTIVAIDWGPGAFTLKRVS